MAKLGKPPETKKRKGRFGSPPIIEEASTTLEAPEHAPTPTQKRTRKARNKTGRTVPFGTKVSSKFDTDFREVAFRAGLKNAELLEKMLELYKRQK